MSASEGDGDEVSTGISLLASVDEQSLRSARADIEDALGDPISVDVSVDAPDVGGSGGVATQPLPDGGLSGVAGESQDEGLSPNRERRFARREHRWARQRTEDQEDLLTAVRDIEDSLDENFTDGGGLLGGLFGGIGDILGDFGGAAALTGAAAALTGAAKALVGAAVALGGGAVLDTVTDTLFGGGGDDSESVKLDEDELQSLSQIEGLDGTLTELVQLQQQTIDSINNIDSGGGGGGGGPFGFNPPDFEFPSPPDFLTDPPTFPDLPDFLGGGGGGGQDVTVTVAPNPLPVDPSPVGLTPTPVPVAETTLPVATPTLPVEQPTLPVEGPVGLTPTPVPVDPPSVTVDVGVGGGDDGAFDIFDIQEQFEGGGGGGGGGINLPPNVTDLPGVDQITDSIGGPAGDVIDGIGGILGGGGGGPDLPFLPPAGSESEPAVAEPVVVEITADATATLGDINVTVNAAFDDLRAELDDVFAEIDNLKRDLEREINTVERELENETRDIRREIDRGLRD